LLIVFTIGIPKQVIKFYFFFARSTNIASTLVFISERRPNQFGIFMSHDIKTSLEALYTKFLLNPSSLNVTATAGI